MANKKRKPRRRPVPPEASAKQSQKPKKDEPVPIPPPDVFPSLRITMSRSFVAATCSPIVIVYPFLIVTFLWVLLLAFGMQIFPSSMVESMAVPPISSLFDLGASASLFGLSGFSILGFFFAITIMRALFLSVLTGLLDEALEYGSVSLLGVLRGLNGFWGMLLYCYLAGAIGLVATQILPQLLGAQFGNTVVPLTLVGGIFFLSFAPAASVRLGVPAREAVARATKGARMPGWQRHLLMVAIYYILSFALGLSYPGASIISANPSFGDLGYVFLATFINVLFMAAFIERWKAVEPYVPRQIRARRQAKPVSKKR